MIIERRRLWLAVAITLCGSAIAHAAIVEPIQIDTGLLTGVAGIGGGVGVFKGIPYAAAPVDALRWRAPGPAQAWTGVRKADAFGPMAMQPPYPTGSFYQREYFSGPQPAMSEDCLYLNVWTAADSAAAKRPVMVWIHGGGTVQGYGSEPCFDGDAFARHGVVLVTFNYRLNVFAHFAHPELSRESDHHVSGNYAELDQIAALQWVQRNIAAFGGDPGNVTVFGQSSGGASINRLLVAPQARGLFHRVILQSAAVLNSRDSKIKLAELEQRGMAFARSAGASGVEALRAKSAADLLKAYQDFKGPRFSPNIDGWVLPELALDIFDRGGQYAVPMLIGSNGDEGPYTAVKADVFRDDARKRYGAKADEFLRLYPADNDEQAAQSKHDVRRDESFTGERAEARAQAKLGAPVYLYYFTRKPPGRDRDRYGAFHAAEVEYVFNTFSATDRPWEAVDRKLADRMISYWTHFAATGNPNEAALPAWPRYDAQHEACMELGDQAIAGPIASAERLDFLEPFVARDAR